MKYSFQNVVVTFFFVLWSSISLELLGQPSVIREFDASVYNPIEVNGSICFQVGMDLWTTDGTTSGTSKVVTLDTSYPRLFSELGGDLIYLSDYTLHRINLLTSENELIFTGSYIDNLVKDDSYVYFLQSDSNGQQRIYRSDGSVAGTNALNIDLGTMISWDYPNISSLIPFNGKLIIAINKSFDQQELWITDGTQAGTVKIRGDNGDGFSFAFLYSGYVILDSEIYFTATDKIHGNELWISDGTASGTHLFVDLNPGVISGSTYPNSSSPSSLRRGGDRFFFTTAADAKLWVSQGTPETTIELKSYSDSRSPVGNLSANDNNLFFTINDSEKGVEPWVTDGTVQGTHLVNDIWNGVGSSMEHLYTKFFPSLNFEFMLADDGVTGMELWGYNRSNEQAGQVMDFTHGPASTFIEELFEVNGKIIFFISTDNFTKRILLSVDLADLSITEPARHMDILPSTYWTQFIGSNISYTHNQTLFNYDMAVTPDDEIVLGGMTDGQQTIFYQNNLLYSVSPELTHDSRNFVTKFNKEGLLLWHRQLNSTFPLYRKNNALDVALDGSIYFATSLIQGLDRGELEFYGEANGYILKLDTYGVQQWVKPIFAGQRVDISRIKVAESGDVFCSGLFFGNSISFQGTTLDSERSPSYFFAKIDRDGNLIRMFTLPDNWDSYGDITDLEFDEKSKHVLLMISDGLRNTASSCEFKEWPLRILCLDFDGQMVWEQTAICSDLMIGSSLSVSANGDIFIVGRYRGTLKLGRFSIKSGRNSVCNIETSFVLKLNDNGEVGGLNSLGKNLTDAYEIEFFKDGTYVISGTESNEEIVRQDGFPWPYPSSEHQVFLRHYDFTGNLLQEKTFNKYSNDFSETNPIMRIDNSDNIILSDRVFGKFDTIAYSPDNSQLNLVVLKTTRAKFTQAYTEEDISGFIQLFPNPANDRLNLKIWRELFTEQAFDMMIYNANGQVILQESLDPQVDVFILSTLDFAPGLYLVKLQNKQHTFLMKVVVVH
ncbi:MAG TPA: T9SS type A sorting domain-containing protein [Cyclobacteriaceae bacterium]|nr:T9SS type A sorting domain-containing protein [Cyclobacteriaceae bacterium]